MTNDERSLTEIDTLPGTAVIGAFSPVPLHASLGVVSERDHSEFLEGARLLRFAGETALPGRKPQPQQFELVDVLAAGHKRNAVSMPRRSSKTTTLQAVGLGRAGAREDFRGGILTLTSGKAGRARFLRDVAPAIERLYPDKKTRPCRVVRIAGLEAVEFPELGGSMRWLSSIDDIRGESFDFLVLDEAGEPDDPARVQEVISAALPTMDTRPGSQLVVAGTAGRYRAGNGLWEALEVGRGGVGGILEYAVSDDLPGEVWDAWEPSEDHPEARARELIELSHPGLLGLTTIDVLHDNFLAMKPEDFAREYGGVFGTVGQTTGVFNIEQWALAGTGGALPTPPGRFVLAFSPHLDQLFTSVVAVWRDEDGRMVPLLLEHRRGIDWAARELARLARQYRTEIVYDGGNQVSGLIAEQLNRMSPRPKLHALTFAEIRKGASLVVDEVGRGNVVHYRQPELDAAVRAAVKRGAKVGASWALGRREPGDDITGAEAWSYGAYVFDTDKPKVRAKGRVAA